jgi:hypothetical protein
VLCAELSRNHLNSDGPPPLFCLGVGVAYDSGMGKPTGGTMPKLLSELERKPCPLALAERDSRAALRDQQSLTAAFFGDPLPGLSALDRRERESLTRAALVV